MMLLLPDHNVREGAKFRSDERRPALTNVADVNRNRELQRFPVVAAPLSDCAVSRCLCKVGSASLA